MYCFGKRYGEIPHCDSCAVKSSCKNRFKEIDLATKKVEDWKQKSIIRLAEINKLKRINKDLREEIKKLKSEKV